MTTKKHHLRENLVPATKAQIRAMSPLIVSSDNGRKVDFSIIIADPEFNKRQDYGDIEELAESIIQNGLQVALKGSFVVDKTEKKETVYFDLSDGFRRHRAIEYLLSIGQEVGLLKCEPNDKCISFEDRIYQMFVTQDNKKLNDLEIADCFRELVNRGIATKEISKRVAKTETYVKDMLELSKQTSYVKTAISEGKTTPTAVNKLSKKSGPDAAHRAVKDATSQNRKFTVNDADAAIEGQTTKRKAIDYDAIPKDLDGMKALRERLVGLTSRSRDQIHTVNVLDAKIRIREDAMTTEEIVPGFAVEFDTKLETEFKSTFCPAIGMDLCGDVYEWFQVRLDKK